MMRFRHLVVVCVLAAAGLVVSANDALASHFRYGSITWSVQNPATPNVITVRFDSVWRWSFPYDSTGVQPNHCPAGFIIIPTGAVTGSGACPALGSPILGLGLITISGGSFVTAITLAPTVTSINSTEDWFSASFQANVTLPPGVNATYTAQFASNARLSSLLGGNADQPFIIDSGITVRVPPLSVNQPPTIGTLPIIVVALNQPTTFQIAASDPNGDVMTFSLSPANQSGLVQIAPPGLSLSSAGAVTWTPTVPGLYAMQVRVTDTLGAYTVADLMLQAKVAVGQPPTVNINGLAAPQTLTRARGSLVTFTVSATDPENTPVMLSGNSLPSGSIMTPSLPMTAVNPSSTFSWTPPSSGIGTYVMSFAGLDGDGRQDSNTMTLTVTNTPPTIACTADGPLIEATGPTGGPFSITANVDDADGDKLTVSLFVDGIQRTGGGLLTPPSAQSYSNTFALGHHTYADHVGDGLSDVACLGTFDVVDTTAPSILVTPGDQTIVGTSASGAVATFTVSAQDAVDTTPTVSCSQASGSTFPFGTTTVTCTAIDDAGNHNETSFTITVTDPTPPIVTPHVTGTLGNNGWYTSGVSVSWTTVDAESGIASTAGCEDQLVNADTASVTFTCTATNGDSVSSAPVSVTVTRDATPPALAFTPASILAEATSAAGAAVAFSPASATDSLSGVAGGVSCTQSSGATFPIGSSVVTCSATDEAGNTGSADLAITVADHTPPTIDAHGNETADATSASGAAVSYMSPATHDVVDGAGTASCSPASGSTFPIGVSTVTCSATDAHGNHATGTTFTVTVIDRPPVIDAHGNEGPAEATSASGAAVSYMSPATHDVVDGAGTASCSPASGSTFPIGVSTVTCAATDAHGNHATNTTFTVTVVDTTAPTIDPHRNETASATSASGAAVSYLSPATHDAVDGTGTASCTPASGSTFPLGTSTVTCSATDAHGNHAAGTTFSVTVTNNAPTFTPPANITTEATGPGGRTVAFVAVGNDVESGLIPAVCSPASGSTFAIGTTRVNCTVTDPVGAMASGSFTVTVVDTTGPAFSVGNLKLHATSPAGARARYAFTATDAVDGTDPVVCVPRSGATFPVGTSKVSCSSTDHAGNVTRHAFTVTVTNTAPVCTLAAPSISTISPPNHQMIRVTINGVTDADGDAVTIRVTGVFQDEPTNAEGDGNTPIDGGGLGTSTALVRAELASRPKAPGNGRVYHIQFTGTDIAGGRCSGHVLVGVPRDQGNRHTLIDDGIKYNSVTGAAVR